LIQDYNRGDKIIITNTFQCYLKRMKTLVPDEIAASKALGYNLGVKLVRGAYMNEERTVAAERGVDSPIWENIEQTHECYDANLAALVQSVGDHGLIMLASHNVDSVALAKEQMASHGIDADRVQFGQLKGFSD
jgi:proline dehydrogenase